MKLELWKEGYVDVARGITGYSNCNSILPNRLRTEEINNSNNY